MSEKLPATIYAEQVPGKGTGLFTSKAIDAGEPVFRIERPLACVPDNEHLAETCYNCFLWIPPEDRSEDDTTLKTCSGCKAAKYCSKRCQSQSWKAEHKHECKALGLLYPKMAPSAIRVVMQLLLRRQAGSISDTEWLELLKLEAHLDDFVKDPEMIDSGMGTKWQDIQLMGQAALAFSGVSQPLGLVQSLVARVMINSMTASTAAFDAIGTCISTGGAGLNHSCNPNCFYIFIGRSLAIRSLQAIPKGCELTISYVDVRTPIVQRQAELKSKWFFSCTCDYCSKGLTCGQPDVPFSLKSGMSAKALSELENEGRRLQDMAEKAPAEEQIEYLTRAMELFTPHSAVYPIWREPWGSIRHDMKVANITQGKWFSALGHALKIYFYIDPVLFPDKWSPQRAMRTYVLLRVITEIAYQISGPQSNEQLHRELSKYEINFLVVAKNLSNEVEMAISKGYGSDHPFAADFQRFKAAEIPTGQFGGRAEWENERAKLKRAADEMVGPSWSEMTLLSKPSY